MNTNIDLFGHLPKPTNMNSTEEKTGTHHDAGQQEPDEHRGEVNRFGTYEDFRKRILDVDPNASPECISQEVWQGIVDREIKDDQSANRVNAWREQALERGKAINAFFLANKPKDWLVKWIRKTKSLHAFKGALFTAENMLSQIVTPKPDIIGDWLRIGDIGFIFAERGVGKTWYAMELGKSIAMNNPMGPWGASGTPIKVLYVDGEVSAADVKDRNFALSITGSDFVYLNHELLFDMEQSTMDVAEPHQQEAFLSLCLDNGFKVVIMDNLSCLAPTVDENDSLDWSSTLLSWVLRIRRHGITLIFIQHAGRNGQMRGHSKREDQANWIIKLNKVENIDTQEGAMFTSVFEKNRNAKKWPQVYEWQFKPVGNKTLVTFKQADVYVMFRRNIEEGVHSNKELADKLGKQPADISKMAARGGKEGWLEIRKGKYYCKK
jgi:hypothetical protein